MPGYSNQTPGTPTLLAVTTVVAFVKGAVGAGGVANDTILNGIKIAQNAAAVTVTLAGFKDSTGAAASIIFTGSTTADTFQPLNWINTFGTLTATASVANKVVVETITSGLVP